MFTYGAAHVNYLRTSFILLILRTPRSTLFRYTTLFRSAPTGSHSQDSVCCARGSKRCAPSPPSHGRGLPMHDVSSMFPEIARRSEEHTSELQSQSNLVCRLLLEKKKYDKMRNTFI